METVKSLLASSLRQCVGYGQLRSQWFFQKMYFHAIYGMNYSNPNHFENGERKAMSYVANKIQSWNLSNPVIFDVGANVGDYAKDLRTTFGAKARIFCFEPGAATFKRLIGSIHNDGNTSAYPFGLGEAEGELVLIYDQPGSSIASLYELPVGHPWKGEQTERVQIKTIDSFSAEQGIERIHFLKIDVEGHELSVLKGASEMIESDKIDFVEFEFGFRQMDSHGYFRDFYELLHDKYNLYRIVQDGIYLIEKYHESLEVFVGVSNYLAQNRVQEISRSD